MSSHIPAKKHERYLSMIHALLNAHFYVLKELSSWVTRTMYYNLYFLPKLPSY